MKAANGLNAVLKMDCTHSRRTKWGETFGESSVRDSTGKRVSNIPLYEFMGHRGCVGSLRSKRGWGGKRKSGQVQGEQRQEVFRKALLRFWLDPLPQCQVTSKTKELQLLPKQWTFHAFSSPLSLPSATSPLSHVVLWIYGCACMRSSNST